MNKRIEWVDMAKAIAIILMIIGHEVNGNIRTLIFSFHMPLFFILSGYTSHRLTTLNEIVSLIKKLFFRIWILAAVMILLAAIEGGIIHSEHLIVILKNTVRGIFWGSYYEQKGVLNVGVMWFLFAYFWGKIYFSLLRLVFKDDKYSGVIFILFAYGSYLVSSHIWFPQVLDLVPVVGFFMWVGAMLKNIKFNQDETHFGIILLVMTFWLFCVQNGLNIDMSMRNYPNFVIVMLESIAGSLVVMYIAKALLVPAFTRWMQFFGRHTLLLMCIHHLDFFTRDTGGWVDSVHSPIYAVLVRLFLDLLIFGMLMLLQKKYTSNRLKGF